MPNFKFTFGFNWETRAGWTENWYRAYGGTPSRDAIQADVLAYCNRRARMLVRGAKIEYCRVSDVATPRKVMMFSLRFNGTLGRIPDGGAPPDDDVPNLGQLVKFTSTGQEDRYAIFRGLDDRDIVSGIIDYGQNGRGATNLFCAFLIAQNWLMRDMQKSLRRELVGIDGATGVITAAAALGYAENDIVVVQTRIAGNGKKLRWQGKIINVNGATGKLKNYKWGDTEGGEIHKLTALYPNFTDFQFPGPNYARTRQTGRPSPLSRGRQPVRG